MHIHQLTSKTSAFLFAFFLLSFVSKNSREVRPTLFKLVSYLSSITQSISWLFIKSFTIFMHIIKFKIPKIYTDEYPETYKSYFSGTHSRYVQTKLMPLRPSATISGFRPYSGVTYEINSDKSGKSNGKNNPQ